MKNQDGKSPAPGDRQEQNNSTPGRTAKSQNRLLHVIMILLLGAAVYSNTLSAPFQWDEETLILANPAVKDTSYLFGPERTKDTKFHATLKNRPVGYFTFALNYKLHGFKVTGYHIFNISVHLMTALLVYLLVILSFRTPVLSGSKLRNDSGRIALFSALLFVAHPVQTEAVTYIFQRLASMCAMFYLLSLSAYVMSRLSKSTKGTVGFYAICLLSAALAMKTKENSFTLPIAITLYEFFFFRGPVRARLLRLGPVLLTLLIVPLGVTGLDRPAGEVIKGLTSLPRGFMDVTRAEYLFTQFRVLVTYLRLLVLPVNQNIDYSYPVIKSLLDLRALLSLVFLAGVFGAGVCLHRRSRSGDHALRLCAFGVFWFFLTLSVESSLIPIPMLINEYRLYLPSSFVFIAFVTGVHLALGGAAVKDPGVNKKRAQWALAAFTAVVLALSVAAFARNSLWRTKVSLWEDVVKKSPGKARGHYNLGNHYSLGGQMDKGIEQYRIALGLKADYIDAHNNLGNALRAKGNIDEAVEHYLAALALNPNYAEAYNNLGAAYASKGESGLAVEHYRIAISLKPGYFNALHNLGIALQAAGKTGEAVKAYEEALLHSPDNFEIHFNLGLIYGARGMSEKAVEHYIKVVRLKPNYVIAYNNMGVEYKNLGKTAKSTGYFQKALTLDPGNYRAYNNLGNNFFVQGQIDEAMEHYDFALRLKPDYPDAHNNMGNALKAKGRLDEAIDSFERAIQLKPEYAEAHFNLAMSYYDKKMPDRAIEHFRKAADANPNYEKAHLNLGVLYFQKGLFKEARRAFEAALRLKPNNPRARRYLEQTIKKL